MRLAYFVHDLTDPAVARRVRMFAAGGAEVVVLGFRRAETAPVDVAGARAIDLGRTYDGRMGQRALATVMAVVRSGALRAIIGRADAIVARTPEMLVVAQAARLAGGLHARLVYECLDIHRMMLAPGVSGVALRAVERALMRRCDLLIVSSPAFLEQYFIPRQGLGGDLALDTLLVENKVLALDAVAPPRPPRLRSGPPWIIGWLGAIRCRRSLEFLIDLTLRRPDLLQVKIHGRPAYSEFEDFDAQVAAAPGIVFGGAYGPVDLPELYRRVHFGWAIDFMEAGQNSAWLLPNRLYEGSRHGAIPIALAGTETSRYLAEHGFGLTIADLSELESRLDALQATDLRELRWAHDVVPDEAFAAGAADCVALVRAVAGGLIPHAAAVAPATTQLVA